MRFSSSRLTLVAVLALAVASALALATHAGPAASAPQEAALVPAQAAVAPAAACPAVAPTAQPDFPAIELAAITPHCCSQGEINACRDGCKAQGPGCKGQISCHAGECGCTCNCP